MDSYYRGIPLYHGSDGVIPSIQNDNGQNDYLYLTPDPQYKYIQLSSNAYKATVDINTPFFTDNLSLIEGLRSNPQRREALRSLGYDSMIYSDRKNPLKGASGWGDDSPQVMLLNPSHSILSWDDISASRKNIAMPDVDVPPSSAIIGPVYHATTSHFVQFDHSESSDIGFHFGTQKAAKHRINALKNGPNVSVEENTASHNDILAAKLESGELFGKPHYPVLKLLLKKLSNPKPNLEKMVSSMSLNELADISEEYIALPDNPGYLSKIENAKYAGTYRVEVNGQTVVNGVDKSMATFLKSAIKDNMLKKAFITIKNPLMMDDYGLWSAEDMLKEAKPSASQKEAFYALDDDSSRYELVRSILKVKGYDGIAYTNEVEDAGKLSYIAFSKEQIRLEPPRLPALEAQNIEIPPLERRMKNTI